MGGFVQIIKTFIGNFEYAADLVCIINDSTISNMTKRPASSLKELDASNLSLASRATLIRRVLVNMKAQSSGATNAGILLAGDPGTGKTTFSRMLAKLLGLNLIVVEIPHILEEHIINIPYLRYSPQTDKVKHYNVAGKRNSDFELTLAKSNLLMQLNDKVKIEDDEYLKNIYSGKYGVNIRRLFEMLGGSPTVIPKVIQDVRSRFSTLLFLDEYFRRTSTSIRNMLRGVLNRRLGFDKLPDSVYVLFASNINDDGVESIPHNNQFSVIDVDRPSKESWFSYVIDRAKDNNVALDDEVLNIFWNSVSDKVEPDIDEDGKVISEHKIWQPSPDPSGVRISPRRLEQMLLYVNSSFPVKNHKAARGLITNVMLNFRSAEGEYSTTALMLIDQLAKKIKQTIPEFTTVAEEILPPHRWRDTLHHQMMRKLRLGDMRSYIPVISGQFGIGKTTAMDSISESLKLGHIYIDCSTLSAEDVSGTPLPATNAAGEDSVEFADSKLYKIIMQQAAEHDPGAATKNGFKYIIFFDELNRTNTKTFNALRKVILEKEFDNGKTLPEGSIVVAAINPEDQGGGVTELTSHMLDVMDIIPAAPNWKDFTDWLGEVDTGIEEHSFEVALHNVVEAFSTHFSPDGATPGFVLEIGTSTPMYISPREYTQIFTEACISVDMTWQDLKIEHQIQGAMSAEVRDACDKALRNAVAEVFLGVIQGLLIKHGYQLNLSTMLEWFNTAPEVNILSGFKEEEIKSASIQSIYQKLLDDLEATLPEFSEVISYLANTDGEQVVSELSEFVETIPDEKLFDKHLPMRFPNDDGEFETTGKVTPITFLFRELINADRLHNNGRHLDTFKQGSAAILASMVTKHGMSQDVYRITTEMAEENFVA